MRRTGAASQLGRPLHEPMSALLCLLSYRNDLMPRWCEYSCASNCDRSARHAGASPFEARVVYHSIPSGAPPKIRVLLTSVSYPRRFNTVSYFSADCYRRSCVCAFPRLGFAPSDDHARTGQAGATSPGWKWWLVRSIGASPNGLTSWISPPCNLALTGLDDIHLTLSARAKYSIFPAPSCDGRCARNGCFRRQAAGVRRSSAFRKPLIAHCHHRRLSLRQGKELSSIYAPSGIDPSSPFTLGAPWISYGCLEESLLLYREDR